MLGKLPFPRWILGTPVKVYQTSLGENGEPVETLLFDGLCCHEDKTKQVLDSERKLVTISGRVILEGDIYPDKMIEGYIQLGELKRDIFQAKRPKNPDGSVFSTELELA